MPQLMSIPGFAEPFSSLSHLLGAGVFFVMSFFMLARGWGDWQRVLSLAIFCLASVFLLVMSGTNHIFTMDSSARYLLRQIDHAAIFVLIAASFTPVHIILFRGYGRWAVLALVWTIALLGIVLKTMFFEAISENVGTALYIGMGWIGLGTWLALARRCGMRFVQPIMWSGIAYTIGGIIDRLSWPVVLSGVIQWHEVFHVAVLIGLGLHWAFVYSIADRPCDTPSPA